MTDSGSRGVQSIEIGISIVSVIAAAQSALPLKTIAARAGMPASKAHRYLSSFIRAGLLAQHPASGHYDLGPLSLQLGLSALSRVDGIRIASDALPDIVEQTGFTALLVVWGPVGPVITRWSRSSPPLVTSLSIGVVLPALTSASGQALIAYKTLNDTSDVIAAELKRDQLGDHAPRNEREVRQLAGAVRERGFAIASGSVTPGLFAASAPVLDAQNEAFASVTLLSGKRPFQGGDDPAVVALVAACREISIQAGARPV